MNTAILELIGWALATIFQCYHVPDKYARQHGYCGCVFGLVALPFFFVYFVYRMVVIFIDRLGVTIANSCFGKQWLYFIDASAMAKVYDKRSLSISVTPGKAQVSNLNALYIRFATKIAKGAMGIFDDCKPCFPENHWNWREASIAALLQKVRKDGKLKLGLSEDELQALSERLDWAKSSRGMDRLSYNRFCLFIGEALRSRFERGGNESLMASSKSDENSVYLN